MHFHINFSRNATTFAVLMFKQDTNAALIVKDFSRCIFKHIDPSRNATPFAALVLKQNINATLIVKSFSKI